MSVRGMVSVPSLAAVLYGGDRGFRLTALRVFTLGSSCQLSGWHGGSVWVSVGFLEWLELVRLSATNNQGRTVTDRGNPTV